MNCDVTYDGTTYPFDFSDMDLPEYFTVKTVAHLNGGQFQVEAMDFNPNAVLALVVLALRRAGKAVVAKDIDQKKVDVNALAESYQAAVAAAHAARAAAAGDVGRGSTPGE